MAMLEIKKIKKYFGEIKAVDDISFDIEQGEIVGLLGPNGAGKSTAISMISSLRKPDEGDILYFNKSIVDNPKDIQKQMGIVPQEIALYPALSAKANLVFWGNAYGIKGMELNKRIEEIAKQIGLSDKLSQRVDKYSGGMKRRLNIGAALLHKPDILIMDEPTVGIDPQSRNHILDFVKNLNKEGITVIYTSHYMEEVEFLCNKIYIMDNGKIIAKGTKQELVKLLPEGKTINIELTKSNGLEAKEIEDIKGVTNVVFDDNKLNISYVESKDIVSNIIYLITSKGAMIAQFKIEEPNLESVFLHLTGKALRD